MSKTWHADLVTNTEESNEKLLKGLAATAFITFFGGYMIAPLIPALSHEFNTTEQSMGWVVPAFMLPYGFSTLVYGALSDKYGRRNVLLILLAVAVLTTFLVSLAWSAESLIWIRVICGLSSGGIVTIALAIVGDLFPYEKLGRAMGWMFGGIAGGMAFGSTFGAWLNPTIGWKNEFIILAVAYALLFTFLFKNRQLLAGPVKNPPLLKAIVSGYMSLVKSSRGSRTYTFIFFNGLFHGGVFSWLGYYLSQRYHLSDEGIGRALLGYGIPGMFLGPLFGKLIDRYGRNKIIPLGLTIAACCSFALIPMSSLWVVTIVVASLSTGLDLSHPPMAGIVASLDPKRRGLAMGLNSFLLFVGLGLGSVVFQFLLPFGLSTAFFIFGAVQLVSGVLAVWFFRKESAAG